MKYLEVSVDSTCMLHKMLLLVLLLSMYNYVGENKNYYIFSFESLLTMRRTFGIVDIYFFIVDDTH